MARCRRPSRFSALAAITQPLAYGIAVTDHGAFASDGVLGFVIP
jgi:hypothetical protein